MLERFKVFTCQVFMLVVQTQSIKIASPCWFSLLRNTLINIVFFSVCRSCCQEGSIVGTVIGEKQTVRTDIGLFVNGLLIRSLCDECLLVFWGGRLEGVLGHRGRTEIYSAFVHMIKGLFVDNGILVGFVYCGSLCIEQYKLKTFMKVRGAFISLPILCTIVFCKFGDQSV